MRKNRKHAFIVVVGIINLKNVSLVCTFFHYHLSPTTCDNNTLKIKCSVALDPAQMFDL